jgi:hypothetical protein
VAPALAASITAYLLMRMLGISKASPASSLGDVKAAVEDMETSTRF